MRQHCLYTVTAERTFVLPGGLLGQYYPALCLRRHSMSDIEPLLTRAVDCPDCLSILAEMEIKKLAISGDPVPW